MLKRRRERRNDFNPNAHKRNLREEYLEGKRMEKKEKSLWGRNKQ